MVIVTVLVGCLSVVMGQTGRIAYIAGESQSDWQVTVMELSSGALTVLGQGQCDSHPQWSPDGDRIAYQSKEPEGLGIRIASVDTGSDIAVPHRFSWNYTPRWSPDGKKLVYISEGDAAPLQSIVVYDLESQTETIWGGTWRGFLQSSWMSTLELMKAIDPDDQEAAEALGLFQMKKEADVNGALIAMGVIGEPPRLRTELYLVTPSLATPLLPFILPDSSRYVKCSALSDHKGRQIVFESNDGGDREIFVLGRRGITNVTNHPAADWNPTWSPDNLWLAFESFREGRRGLFKTLVSTANVSPVIIGDHFDCWHADWSPDGEWIVFVSDMSGTAQLHLIRPDGSDLRQITEGPGESLNPVWRPKVKKNQLQPILDAKKR